MDYVEAFKNLRTNNKYGRKSPHKAVLMLTVIELFEKNILTDNEIFYDDSLKSMFLKVWNRVLPDEPIFHPEAYLPFWYLQSDSFWHIVPLRGKEDILSLMRDTNIKPSETKLIESVKCAELDDDLFFLMTIPSGRSSLKRALLETYTTLSEEYIDIIAESKDNTIDHSAAALSEYDNILSQGKCEEETVSVEVDKEIVQKFQLLNEDVQIALNFEYYSFLRSHRGEREMLWDICPTVYDLLDKIVYHPVKQGEIAPSFAFSYDNFLSDLKISLMSEEGALELIDKIGDAIDLLRGNNKEEVEKDANIEKISPSLSDNISSEVLIDDKEDSTSKEMEVEHVFLDSCGNIIEKETISNVASPEKDFATENRKGQPWSEYEEELISLYFQKGNDISTIASIVGRTEIAIKSRLAKLGLIDYSYEQDISINTVADNIKEAVEKDLYKIENLSNRCSIINRLGNQVYTSVGKLIELNGLFYRISYTSYCLTINEIDRLSDDEFVTGQRIIYAQSKSDLYSILNYNANYRQIDAVVYHDDDYRIKVANTWYDSNGNDVNRKIEDSKEDDDCLQNQPINDGNSKDDNIQTTLDNSLVGKRIRILPSQEEGVVLRTRIDKKGLSRLVVQADDNSILETYNDPYFYEVLAPDKDSKRKRTRIPKREIIGSSSSVTGSKASIGNWLLWKPTGIVGKVIRFIKIGSLHKIVLKQKNGDETEIYDNPKAYEIMM